MATSDCIIIPLTRGYSTVVDRTHSDLLSHKWTSIESNGKVYAVRYRRVNGKFIAIFMHRVILARLLGRPLLSEEKTDHKDGDGLNNLDTNLRLAVGCQNSQNRKINRNSSTGYKGVSKSTNGKDYRARIQVGGKSIYLGNFQTPELAAAVYDEAAIKYHGEFAKTNA